MIKLIDASNALAAIDSSHHDKEDGFMRYRRRGFLQKIRRVGDGMMRWWRVYREGWRDWWIGEEKRGRTRTRSVVVGGAVWYCDEKLGCFWEKAEECAHWERCRGDTWNGSSLWYCLDCDDDVVLIAMNVLHQRVDFAGQPYIVSCDWGELSHNFSGQHKQHRAGHEVPELFDLILMRNTAWSTSLSNTWRLRDCDRCSMHWQASWEDVTSHELWEGWSDGRRVRCYAFLLDTRGLEFLVRESAAGRLCTSWSPLKGRHCIIWL